MAALYLLEQNTVLRKSGDRLLFCKKRPPGRTWAGVRQDDILLELPCADVTHVMVFGNIQITTQTMHHLLERGIEMALFTAHGRLRGQLTPPVGKNILLRQKQYKKHEDADFVLEYSKTIVAHKIFQSLDTVKRYAHNHPKVFETEEFSRLEEQAAKIHKAQDLDSLLGYEGSASAMYFKLLGRMLPKEWRMKGRNRRPPKDPPNAVLSFGYTIVSSELLSLLDGVGFDPFLGYYHQIHYGRPSLALDMLELFRHSFTDRLMLQLFNLRILNNNDFRKVGEGGIYLSNSGKKKFFVQYERMAGHYKGEVPNKNAGIFRRAFQDQVELLQDSVQNDVPLKIFTDNIL